MTDQEMVELEPEIIKSCEEAVLQRDHLSRLVIKERWLESKELTGWVKFEYCKTNNGKDGVDYSLRTYGLKHAAVNSPKINISYDVDKELIKHTMRDAATWVWSYFFRDELVKLIRHRIVIRNLSDVSLHETEGLTRIMSEYPKRINLFGKTVPAFITEKSAIGVKYLLNRKYRRAAEQVIFFHPDIAHFQFLNPERWVGEIHWKNIPDIETNPDCNTGFYRLVATAAARPIFPDYGMVVTVVPEGIRGFFYYWIWKLFRFVP